MKHLIITACLLGCISGYTALSFAAETQTAQEKFDASISQLPDRAQLIAWQNTMIETHNRIKGFERDTSFKAFTSVLQELFDGDAVYAINSLRKQNRLVDFLPLLNNVIKQYKDALKTFNCTDNEQKKQYETISDIISVYEMNIWHSPQKLEFLCLTCIRNNTIPVSALPKVLIKKYQL